MGTRNSSKVKGTGASAPAPEPGRAARTKVSIPGGSSSPAASSGAASSTPPKRRPPAPPRPWYRKGRFWLAVILLEVVVAYGLSVRFMPSTEDVALDGADLGRFCQIVVDSRSLATDAPAQSAGQTAQLWGTQADTLDALRSVAPEEVRPDIDELVVLTRGVRDLAADVEQRNLSDPAYDGSGAINDKIAAVERDGELATKRLNVAVLKGCGIDLSVPVSPPSTVGVTPGPNAPASSTVAPGGGGGLPTTTAGSMPPT